MNKEIGETVKAYLSEVEVLKSNLENNTKELYRQIKEIERSHNDRVDDVEQKLLDIQSNYIDAAFRLANKSKEVPNRFIGYLEKMEVIEKGILLSYEIEYPYTCSSYCEFLATWDALENEKKKEL